LSLWDLRLLLEELKLGFVSTVYGLNSLLVPDHNELHGVFDMGRGRQCVQPVLGCLKVDVSSRKSGKHLNVYRVSIEATHSGVAAVASPVG